MKVDSTKMITITNDRWLVRTCEAGDIDICYSITCEDHRFEVAAEDIDELEQLRDCIDKYLEIARADP